MISNLHFGATPWRARPSSPDPEKGERPFGDLSHRNLGAYGGALYTHNEPRANQADSFARSTEFPPFPIQTLPGAQSGPALQSSISQGKKRATSPPTLSTNDRGEEMEVDEMLGETPAPALQPSTDRGERRLTTLEKYQPAESTPETDAEARSSDSRIRTPALRRLLRRRDALVLGASKDELIKRNVRERMQIEARDLWDAIALPPEKQGLTGAARSRALDALKTKRARQWVKDNPLPKPESGSEP